MKHIKPHGSNNQESIWLPKHKLCGELYPHCNGMEGSSLCHISSPKVGILYLKCGMLFALPAFQRQIPNSLIYSENGVPTDYQLNEIKQHSGG